MITSTYEKKKKKDSALKVSTSNNYGDNEKVALLSCNFNWFLIQRTEGMTKPSKNDSNDVTKYYKYRKPCHMMANCPCLKASKISSKERKTCAQCRMK